MRTIYTLAAAILIATSSAPAFANDTQTPGILSIQGTGITTATPDIATISSGVITQAETARDALNANTAAMSQLIEVLKGFDIEDRDIQTSNFSVQPQYVYSNKRDDSGYTQAPKIVGYQVSNNVSVRVRDLSALGELLDQTVTIGANSINNITFGVDETGPLYSESRKRAVADAIAKAELYAAAANVELGRILTISEGSFTPIPVQADAMYARAEMAMSAPVPVQAGELTYTIDVSIRWELDQ